MNSLTSESIPTLGADSGSNGLFEGFKVVSPYKVEGAFKRIIDRLGPYNVVTRASDRSSGFLNGYFWRVILANNHKTVHELDITPANPFSFNSWLDGTGPLRRVKVNSPDSQSSSLLDSGHQSIEYRPDIQIQIRVNDGKFGWFGSASDNPVSAVGDSTISRRGAIRKANQILEFSKRSSFRRDLDAELGSFFDEVLAKTVWTWKVMERSVPDGYVFYIIAESGEEISVERVTKSRHPYEPSKLSVPPQDDSRTRFDLIVIDIAKKLLQELGRSDLHLTTISLSDGMTLRDGEGSELKIHKTGKLISFSARRDYGSGKKDGLYERGVDLIKLYNPSLPQGKFEFNDGSPMTVNYRQVLLGLPVFNRDLVTVGFGGDSKVVLYKTTPIAIDPKQRPKGILPAKQLEARLMKSEKPKLPENTDKVTYWFEVHVGEMGWYVVDDRSAPRLAYSVSLMSMRDVKNWAIQGGGTTTYFDAVTGEKLTIRRP